MARQVDEETQLFLANRLSDDRAYTLLEPAGFADWRTARQRLQRITDNPPAQHALADCLPYLFHALATAAHPDQVLVNFERFAHHLPDQVKLFRYLADNPRLIEILVTLFAGSQFLTEILLRNPAAFERIANYKLLAKPKGAEQLYGEGRAALAPLDDIEQKLDALRRFQRQELLRIGTCDLLDLFDLPTVTRQLSFLADSLAQLCLDLAACQLGLPGDELAIIAMGKLGGVELNYSSDIDLLFLVKADATAYRRLGQRLIEMMTRMTGEGFLYRVDMRLQPWGQSGGLVHTVDSYMTYLAQHARLWEKQALLKARCIAGNRVVGDDFICRAEPLIFGIDRGTLRAEVHALKQKIEAQLSQGNREWGEVKLGKGSIRDVEFVTQYLQLLHGEKNPKLHTSNTLEALTQLLAGGFLPADDHQVLVHSYIFLRTIEHHLQLMHYRQTHTLPTDPEALAFLARRLGFAGPEAGKLFVARYEERSQAIRAVYHWHLAEANIVAQKAKQIAHDDPPAVVVHKTRMHPAYTTVFSQEDIAYHVALIETLDESHLARVEAAPLEDDHWRVTIVGYDYLGELSLICGLLSAYGFDILDGQVFTYAPMVGQPAVLLPAARRPRRRRRPPPSAPAQQKDTRQKIVDAFTVRPVSSFKPDAELWARYGDDLTRLLHRLQGGDDPREVQGELATRVALALPRLTEISTTLYPVDIVIDNDTVEQYTMLHIDALDTVGFLYELTSALAISGIYIGRVIVESVGNRVQDTLYVTDTHGQKITTPERQRELRAATVLIKHFTHLLPRSPNPELALLQFREFVGHLFTRPNWPDEFASLEQPEVLNSLAQLLGASDFLWNDFLRMQHENLFPVVQDVAGLAGRITKKELRLELERMMQAAGGGSGQRDSLNAFKDREMFRIDMRQIMGHTPDFEQFSAELTDLAEVVLEAAYRLCIGELRKDFGLPHLANGRDCPVTICALGKMGGGELGFASDIELMFIFAGIGQTTGPRVITTTDFYDRLTRQVKYTIRTRHEGIFELDLQLRPYGKAGSMAVSLDAFQRYFAPSGDAWPYERQALIKLRPIAGDEKLGHKVEELRDQYLYNGAPFDVAAMRAMRERQIRHLVAAGTINAKFSPGALADLEYLIQGLQITHGHKNRTLRLTNTGAAMLALKKAGILTAEDYTQLNEAFLFLRRLINALRVVRGNAKDLTVPPPDSDEFAFLARRLSYSSDLARLWNDLTHHTGTVQQLNYRLLG